MSNSTAYKYPVHFQLVICSVFVFFMANAAFGQSKKMHIEQLNGIVDSLYSAVVMKEMENASYLAQISSLRQEISNLKNDLDKSQKERDKLTNEKESCNRLNSGLNQEVANLRDSLQQCKEQLSRLANYHYGRFDSEDDNGSVGEVEVWQTQGGEERLEEPVSFAQEMPQYHGGELQMQKDIMENAPYPEMEKENNIQGKVYVQFVVEKDGSISNVRVQRGVQGGPNLSKVAENAVRRLKRFAPAKQNGRPVRLVMTIPVNFTLK